MSHPWRELKVGDKVRMTIWPKELDPKCMHKETISVYRWLIRTGSVLTIERIDAYGLPFGAVTRTVKGIKLLESLALNHGGIEILRDS